MAKEVSDKVIIALLITAVVVSFVGSYFVLESINEGKSLDNQPEPVTESSSVGYVTLNIVETTEVNGFNEEN